MNTKYNRRSFLQKSAAAGAMAAAPLAGFGQGLEDAIEKANLSSRPTDLRITEIRAGYYRGGSRMFVKIYTNQGIEGHGEGVDATPGTYHLVGAFSNMLSGQDPLNIHRHFERIRRSGLFRGAQAGMYVAVLTAVETALWDLAGKALDLPVYQLLGGKFRDRCRLYVDTVMYATDLPTPDDFAESARTAVDMGFNALKYDLDEAEDPYRYDMYNWTTSPGELMRMEASIAAVREEVGPYIDICVDLHGRYDLPSAKKIAKLMEQFDLMWLEEPVPAENDKMYRQIQEGTSTPICGGENHYLTYGFRELFELGGVDIIMPDIQKCGGLGESQRIANYANTYYIPFAPHMVASYLGAMAATHVCASVPNFMVLEWQIYYHTDPMWEEIVDFEGDMITDDGFIELREVPGIGVEINEEALRRYAQPGVPFFEPFS